jgi:hypothetical protein
VTLEEINDAPAGTDIDIALHQALGFNATENNVQPYSSNVKAAFRALEAFMDRHPCLIYQVSASEHPADFKRKPERFCGIVGNFGETHNPGAYISAEAAAETVPLAITRAILKAFVVGPVKNVKDESEPDVDDAEWEIQSIMLNLKSLDHDCYLSLLHQRGKRVGPLASGDEWAEREGYIYRGVLYTNR